MSYTRRPIHLWDASSINLTVGSTTSTISDLQTMFDGNIFTIEENNSTPAITFDVTFSNIHKFKAIVFNGYYSGTTTHNVNITAYNNITTNYDSLIYLPTANANNYRYIEGSDGSSYVDGNGDVILRFDHPVNGNTSHRLYIDYIGLGC